MAKHFGGQMQRKLAKPSFPMARCSSVLDVGTGLTWHSSLLPYQLGELAAVSDHLDALPDNALTLYDRGYPGFYLMALHRQRRKAFCVRVTRGLSAGTDALFASESAPRRVTLTAGGKARKWCKQQQIDTQALTLRAIRVQLKDTVEVLLTSLMDEGIPDAEFADLYQRRWTIEGDFRHLKSRLQFENWSGKSVLSVKQDVHARLLAKNLVNVVAALAQQQLDQTHAEHVAQGKKVRPLRVNRTHALHCSKHLLIAYLHAPRPETLEKLVTLVLRQTHTVRKDRTTQRNFHNGKSNRYPMAYKQTA